MGNLILSRYTHLFQTLVDEEVHHLIYNSRTNAFLRINKQLYKSLMRNQQSPDSCKLARLSNENRNLLFENKIIVQPEDDDAYLAAFKLQTNVINYTSSHLSLSIAPTTACNFACPYCYEQFKPNVTMSVETINNLVDFINAHKAVKTISITWYGGEPLMAFSVIKEIVTSIEAKCIAKLTTQDMVTNGYNVSDDMIEFFKIHPLSHIQITIDGTEDMHNKTRMLLNGKGTYKKILANVEKIVAGLPNSALTIRMNISKENQDEYTILSKELQTKFGHKVSFYPGFLYSNNEDCTDLTCDSMKQEDIIDFYNKLEDRGQDEMKYYPTIYKNKGCVATFLNAYVVGPAGELYKCWNDIGSENSIVGNISQRKLSNPILFNRYMMDGCWTSNETCCSCFFLPICNGGCAWQRLRNKHYGGQYNFCCLQKTKGIDYFLERQYKKHFLHIKS